MARMAWSEKQLQMRLRLEDCTGLFTTVLDTEVLKGMADEDNAVTLQEVLELLEIRKDIFVTHEHSVEGDSNEAYTARSLINSLVARNYRVCYVEDEANPDVNKAVFTCVSNSRLCLVVVTPKYLSLIDSDSDNCSKTEFDWMIRRQVDAIAVVLEREMTDVSKWNGRVREKFEGTSMLSKYFTPSHFEVLCEKILRRLDRPICTAINNIHWESVKQLLIPPLQDQNSIAEDHVQIPVDYEEILHAEGEEPVEQPIEEQLKGDSPAEENAPIDTHNFVTGTEEGDKLVANMVKYFSDNTSLKSAQIQSFSSLLLEEGVGSIDKLAKKLVRTPNYLSKLKISEMDEKIIKDAVLPGKVEPPKAPCPPPAPVQQAPVPQMEESLVDIFIENCRLSTTAFQIIGIRDAIQSHIPSPNEQHQLFINYFNGVTRVCVDKESSAQLGNQPGMIKDIVDYINSHLRDANVVLAAVKAIQKLCRFEHKYSSQVETNVTILVDYGVIPLILKVLRTYYKEHSPITYRALLVINAIAVNHHKSFLDESLSYIIYECIQIYCTFDPNFDENMALAISYCMNNLSRFNTAEMITLYNILDIRTPLQTNLIDNDYCTSEETKEWIKVVCRRLAVPSPNSKATNFLVLLMRQEKPPAEMLVYQLYNLAELCTSEANNIEYSSVPHFLDAVVELLGNPSVKVVEAAMMLAKKLMRYGVKASSQVKINAERFSHLEAILHIIGALNSHWSDNPRIATYGAFCINSIALDHYTQFLNLLDVLNLLVNILSKYSAVEHLDNSVCQAVSFALNNLTRMSTPEILDRLNSIGAKRILQTQILDNPLIDNANLNTKDWVLFVVGRLK